MVKKVDRRALRQRDFSDAELLVCRQFLRIKRRAAEAAVTSLQQVTTPGDGTGYAEQLLYWQHVVSAFRWSIGQIDRRLKPKLKKG